MLSGLKFVEDYVDVGVLDVIEMLFGFGFDDVVVYVVNFLFEYVWDMFWNYFSGISNIVVCCVFLVLNKIGDMFECWMFD